MRKTTKMPVATPFPPFNRVSEKRVRRAPASFSETRLNRTLSGAAGHGQVQGEPVLPHRLLLMADELQVAQRPRGADQCKARLAVRRVIAARRRLVESAFDHPRRAGDAPTLEAQVGQLDP